MYSIKSKKKTRGTASKIANDTFRSENIIPQAFSVGKKWVTIFLLLTLNQRPKLKVMIFTDHRKCLCQVFPSNYFPLQNFAQTGIMYF